MYYLHLSHSQSLYYIIGNYHLRVLVLSLQEKDPYFRMAGLRPVPSAFVAFGSTRKGGLRIEIVYHLIRERLFLSKLQGIAIICYLVKHWTELRHPV